MDGAPLPKTSTTLLAKLRCTPADQTAWGEFVDRYGPRIYAWCRHWRLQEADAQDVTQTVLGKLAEKMRTFAYDPKRSFRGWLKALTHNAWQDLLTSRRTRGRGAGAGAEDLLDTVEARDELVTRLEEEFDHELLAEATRRVRARVEPRTWDAFRLLALDGQTGAQAAAQLGMKVATVFVARSKVQKMLQHELLALDPPDPVHAEAPA